MARIDSIDENRVSILCLLAAIAVGSSGSNLQGQSFSSGSTGADGRITDLENARYAAVELRTTHQHGVEPSIGPEARRKVKQRFANSEVRLLSFGTTCRFQSPDPEEGKRQLEMAKSFIDLAQDTGARGIKLQPQGFAPNVSKETTIRYFGTAMHELGESGAPRGVETWMQVHGHFGSGSCRGDAKGGRSPESRRLLEFESNRFGEWLY